MSCPLSRCTRSASRMRARAGAVSRSQGLPVSDTNVSAAHESCAARPVHAEPHRPAASHAAVLMPNWVGDLVMALSVVSAKERADGAAPLLVVPQPLVELARVLGDAPVVPYRRGGLRGWWATRRDVRAHNVDTLYLLPHSFSSALFGAWCGIRRRRGIVRDGRKLLLTDALPRALRRRDRHITVEYATLLECDPPDIEHWEGRPAQRRDEYRDAVVICPGARYGPAKQWQGFANLARALNGSRVLIMGGAADRAEGERIVQASPSNTLNLAGRTSLVEAAAILSSVRCVISNDSGLMHLAGFVGTPVVGIFGSTSPTWTRPLGTRVRIMYTGEPCSPCLDRECRFGHYRCLRAITVEEVAREAHELCGMG
ncbi:MAG: lipopolysaccharide heptosyltransferase II [Chitinivibrionales bacterium]|nr:lipopolysaccharide heptosyltransferase II [Chitinivibrionales bacterium]